MLNGSPHKEGSTYTALSIIADELAKYGVESEIFHVGTKPISGCLACYTCKRNVDKKCVIDDVVNEFAEKAKTADGYIFGSPVYFAGASGQITSFLDRLFISARDFMTYKPACSIVCERRGGATVTYDQMNKYIGFNNMIQVPSKYWNMMIGRTPEEVLKDTEGVEIMKNLAKNMAWLLNVLHTAEENGITKP